MFSKFKFLTSAAVVGMMASTGIHAADYCTSGTLTRTDGGRNMNSFTLTDGTSSCSVDVNQSPSYGSASYFDKTDRVLTTQAGATISFGALSWTGLWMHGYMYVDYNNDGTFNTTLNANGDTSGELVSFSYYNENDTDNATAPNSAGQTAARNSGVSMSSMPSFKIPESLPGGDYRLRFKVDWNSLDPCGSTVQKDGGCIVDITLRIDAPTERTVTVKSSDTSKGTVSITGTTGLSIRTTDPVEINATAKEGFMFVNWTNDANSQVFSGMSTATVYGYSDISLTANFDKFSYGGMKRYYTGGASQQNRYLARVTTTGTNTPEVFNATSQDQLPYTAYTSGANTKVESGALIDKTATPITVEHGTRSFDITYYGWTEKIGTYSPEINWTQEAYFVDWNNNGSFTDEGEISDKGSITMPNPELLTGLTRKVTIPENQEPGTYRMRVVFFEPASSADQWQQNLFGTINREIRNGVSYDFDIEILDKKPMTIASTTLTNEKGEVAPGRKDVPVAKIIINASGSLRPISATAIDMAWLGDANITSLRWTYSTDGTVSDIPLATLDPANPAKSVTFDQQLATGMNYFILVADVADDSVIGTTLKADVSGITLGGKTTALTAADAGGIEIADIIDYTLGNALWFDTPNSSTAGRAIWNTNDFSSTSNNPDQIWERKSYPIGNGSFGATILGSISSERIVLNEKTLWKGGPGTGASTYWNMNNEVSDATLSQIRSYLASGNTSSAHSLVSSNYRGKIDYTRDRFGVFTTMGEVYVNTGLSDNNYTNYKRIVNMDRSVVVVQFESNGTKYQRRYFSSYPDSVMVWRFTSEGEAQDLTFTFNTPQNINSVTSPEDGALLYDCKLANNNMRWAMKVLARVNGAGTVKADATNRTITVSGANDVEFLLAADTDYAMNFDPDVTDASAFVGVDPIESVNAVIANASAKTYDELYAAHYDDYSSLFSRVSLEINPSEKFENIATPTRLRNYRSGTLDHGLEQLYFQYGRYLLISSSRAGNMPANLQGMWHNNTDGPWRVDYHNNINLQMNYWPATCANLLECYTPYIDYVRGLVKPGERTAQAYYGARGWTAEVSTNIFGFTAPLNSTDMSWNYNPTAGPWLATQMWEYYDYTRDEEWLRNVGYPIIKGSANFVSDLLYMHNGTYTSAPSYSPEHGTADLGATYANAVTREVLSEAIQAAEVLGETPAELEEWREKLDKMYPYQVGRYGQLQEWYNDIDTYGDQHRHTNHLFGLHPGTSINALKDTELVDACKETLKQRGDAATGWSMGWKLNHWARLLDGDHAYILFQNLLKEGTADNMWDLHPPFQIDGNFGGTAGITELFLQSHNGVLHLLPALPSKWTDGAIRGLRTRGNFEVDIVYAGNKLDHAVIRSNAGTPCKVYYNGKTLEFDTEKGESYTVRYNPEDDTLIRDIPISIEGIEAAGDDTLTVCSTSADGTVSVAIEGPARGNILLEACDVTGRVLKRLTINKQGDSVKATLRFAPSTGIVILRAGTSAVKFRI